ncbi:MAG: RNA polymerase sigma factor [Pricia sp.]|nr:RNA polymerase sigma factor [Pricia sp.]
MVRFLRKLFLVLIGDRFQSNLDRSNPYAELSDEELVKIIVDSGNDLLFGYIYDRYANKIFNKCFGFAKSIDEAEDLTQDVFLMIFVKLGSFREQSKFSSWVYALTYNFCVNYVNRNKERKIRQKSDQFDSGEHKFFAEVEDRKLLELRSDKLKKALDSIDPEDKSILLLKYQDDVSIKELCTLLNIGESATKMRLKRAKAKVVENYKSIS